MPVLKSVIGTAAQKVNDVIFVYLNINPWCDNTSANRFGNAISNGAGRRMMPDNAFCTHKIRKDTADILTCSAAGNAFLRGCPFKIILASHQRRAPVKILATQPLGERSVPTAAVFLPCLIQVCFDKSLTLPAARVSLLVWIRLTEWL